MFESDKMSRFEINKRNKLILIQLIFKLSLYLKYLFKSEKSKKSDMTYSFVIPVSANTRPPKQYITYTGTCPAIIMKNINITEYNKLNTIPNEI